MTTQANITAADLVHGTQRAALAERQRQARVAMRHLVDAIVLSASTSSGQPDAVAAKLAERLHLTADDLHGLASIIENI